MVRAWDARTHIIQTLWPTLIDAPYEHSINARKGEKGLVESLGDEDITWWEGDCPKNAKPLFPLRLSTSFPFPHHLPHIIHLSIT